MKRIIYIGVALVIMAIIVFRLKSNKESTEAKVYQYDKEQAIHVQGDTLSSETEGNENFFAGSFDPARETKISADIQGKIDAVLVDAGSIVKKGQALIQLDKALLKLQLQSVEIQIEGLEADVNRFTVLANADAIQGIQLEKAVLGLKSARVQKATLMEQINKATIVAPFAGIVTAKLTEEGAFAAPGVPLLQITDISKLKFTVNIPESDLSQFAINQTCKITADALPEISMTGKVILTGSKANTGNSFPVQFSVTNTPDLKIKAGMFGKVMINNRAGTEQIIIPASVIVGTTIQPMVYVIKDGRAYQQRITISGRIQNKVIVAGGLSAGDVIVTNGFINLFDGAHVLVN